MSWKLGDPELDYLEPMKEPQYPQHKCRKCGEPECVFYPEDVCLVCEEEGEDDDDE